jgi:hypothetical protein
MTAMSVPPTRLAQPRSARALGLELKRNAVPYLLPLLAAVFYFNTVRTADGFPPVWTLRASVIGDHMLFEFSAFAGGLAAWAGSREGRRKTVDLVATTSRAAWARRSIALAGTLCWLLVAFLAGVAALYIKTALQATWGGPPVWPVVVGAAGVTAVTVIGFTCGVIFPGRFTAPLVAIGTLLLYQAGLRAALGITPSSGAYAMLSPAGASPAVDAGVYYHIAPDQSIVQVMFMAGIAVALFGVIGIVPGLHQMKLSGGLRAPRAATSSGDGWLARAAALLLIAAGVAASGTAFSLAGTAKPDAAGGWAIPALHSAASDRPVPVTPTCTTSAAAGSGFTVCVHPAFGFYLTDVAAALNPVAAQIAGLPGAPTSAREVASGSAGQTVMSGITGKTPIFEFTAEHVGSFFGEFFGIPGAGTWRAGFQQGLLNAFLAGSSPGAGPNAVPLGAAQQAVENGLLAAAGSPPWNPDIQLLPTEQPAAGTPAAVAAAKRFAALSASARHAWLATHLTALRAGQIMLAQVP